MPEYIFSGESELNYVEDTADKIVEDFAISGDVDKTRGYLLELNGLIQRLDKHDGKKAYATINQYNYSKNDGIIYANPKVGRSKPIEISSFGENIIIPEPIIPESAGGGKRKSRRLRKKSKNTRRKRVRTRARR